MEAQGMVAIVQGLRDAGLTVTLIGDRRARRLTTPIQSSLPHARSSVETSTKGVAAAATVSCVDTAAQICDDRYMSSYQLAHCMARPSSPPVRLAEFPPQRAKPCRTQGNFEIGGLSSGEIHPALQITHRAYYLRNSFTNDNRDSLSKRQSSRGTQEFVHSLRKYPSMSPNRSVSSELVQRLIAYTQAKNITKRSYSKSMRSLRNQNADPPKEANPRTKVSKSVQTYTRTKRRKEDVPPVKDRDGRTNEDRDAGSSAKKCRTRSPYNMTRNNRFRDTHISATYDYLKIPSPRHFAAADVRYLTDVTRCLRDTLQQICDDRAVAIFQVCPNIQNRYSQHRRQHHRDGTGLQSSSASNNVGAQASLPMECTGLPAMSSCEAIPGTYQQTCSRAINICCRCRKPVPCGCGHSSSKDRSAGSNLDASRESEIEEQVFNWLEEIPVYANDKLEDKATRENMARHLINELKALKDSNDFDQEARKAIAKCVDNMPMWFPENKEVQDKFKAQIVENLTGKFSDVSRRKNKFTEEIVQWVDKLDFESRDDGGQIINKQNVVDNLINKLKPIALNTQPDTEEYREALKAKIVNAMNELPLKINGDKVTNVNTLADNLASRLFKIPTKYSSQEQQEHLGEQLQKEIWEWLKDIPQFANSRTSNIKENQKNVEFLAQTLQKLHAKGVNNLETQEQMQNEINEWLENNIEGKNQIVLREKSNLVDKLIGKLLKLEKGVSRDKREKSSSTTPSNTRKIIRDWMQDIPDLMSEDEEKNQEIVESLAEKFDEFQSLGKNGTSLEREIFNCLTSMLEKKGKRINTENQNDLVRQLIGRLKTERGVEAIVEADKHVIQDIIDCFRDIPEIDMNLEVNKKMAEVLAREVQTLQTEELKESDEKKIKDAVVDWLTEITADSGSKLSTTTKNQLVQKLMNIATATHKPRRRWSKLNDSQKVKKSLREEVGYVLDRSGTDFEDQEEMVSILTDILVDQVMRSDGDSETSNRILNALKASYIPHEQSEGIASRLMKIVNEMSLSFKTQDSTSIFKDNMSSTPKRTSFEKEISFRPRRNSTGSTISTINDISQHMHTQAIENEEQQYINQLLSIIDGWMNNLPIDLESDEGKRFKDVMVRDLAGDIVDRQKYLQLNPDAKTSDSEELEHLKYQVFRWLNKLPDVKSLLPSISKADHLMDRIKSLSVPQLKKSSERSSQLARNAHVNNLSKDLAILRIEILKWIEAVPEKFYAVSDKKHQLKLVEELAEQIHDIQRDATLTESVFNDVSSQWLLKILKEYNEHYFNSLIEGLKELLVSKKLITLEISNLMKETSRVKSLKMVQEDSEKHPQALSDSILNAIKDWTNSLPLQVRKTSAAKKELEDLKREFAETIHNIGEQHRSPTEFRDQNIRDEINKYWHAFPIEPAKKKDANFSSKKVNDLHAKLIALGNLEPEKELPFENDTIYTIILKWSKNLPWQPKKRVEKSQIDQLATKIEKIMANVQHYNFKSISSNLEKEIKIFVAGLSVQKNKLKDSQVRELINKIIEFYNCNLSEDHSMANTSPQVQTTYTDNSVSSKPGFRKAADILYENIEKWCDNLPIQVGSTPEEKEKVKTLKQSIASKLINIIGDLNMKPEIFNDDLLYEDLLNDEIDNLLSTLPLNPMLERNIPALKDNLVEKVKEVRQKTQDELAGQAYKQQLREAISRNLPSVENLTLEEQAPFEILKDNVADAFVELHYAADNDRMKTKLRNRISNEINNFCNDYLKRYPASPIDPGQLNSELYGVLQKIPIPKDETIKSQVEQVRIKDKINDWINELPLKKEEIPSEKLQRKKIVAIMAKDLHDIEKEKESNPHIDVGNLMKKEIKKWIRKLPIQPNHEDNVEQMVEKLVSKLISSEGSKENGNSYIRHNADFVELEKAKPSSIKTLPLSTYVPHLPPSTLSTEDRAHLQRIRERNQTDFMPSYSPCQYKDASVSPIPIDTGSQADLEETKWQTTSAKTTQSCECSLIQSTKSIQSQSSPYNQSPLPQSSKRRECPVPDQAISPQVEVREYYWDSTNEGQAQDPSVIPYAVLEQQGYADKTLPSPPPQKFVTLSDRMGQRQTMTQKSPFVTPQSSPHRQTQCAPRMTTSVESSQPFMTSQPPYITSDRPLEPCGPQLPMIPCPYQSTMQNSQRTMAQPNIASGPPEKSLYVPQTPCMAEPYSATPAPPHQSPHRIPPCVSQETPREERRRGTSKPYFASREFSGTSSPFDTDIPEEETRTRVTRLGSLDDVPYTKTCGSQSPKPKRSRASPNEDFDWTIRFPEDTGFWGTPCPRRRPHKTPQRESFVTEKVRKEEKMRCRCQERTRTKCMGRRPETCHQSSNHPIHPEFMNQCPKCCGVHCPHPSYLFFR